MQWTDSERIVVIGAGPAGLGAASELARLGAPGVCLEASDSVGGMCRTPSFEGFRFDLGGHRFFTRISRVDALWRETLGEDFLKRPRLSRIYYRDRFFHYPIQIADALVGLGPVEAVRIVASYARSRHMRPQECVDFEGWVISQFGRRIYEHFFQAYTEKIWGRPCHQISAEWGGQRIRGLSLYSAVKSALIKPPPGSIRSLIDSFDYPRLGPGQMYEAMATQAAAKGIPILRNHQVVALRRIENRISHVQAISRDGLLTIPVRHVLSSMPLTELVQRIEPSLPEPVLEAARALRYRSFLIVHLVVDQAFLLPDCWVYIPEPRWKVGRIQFFKNWSPHLIPDQTRSSVGCEYFVDEGDSLWSRSDDSLIALATDELRSLGIVRPERILGGCVARVPKAYPVLDLECGKHLSAIREALASIQNLFPIGRYGMFKYNNMDHSLLTGILAARNIHGENHNLWQVNTEQDYLEEGPTVSA